MAMQIRKEEYQAEYDIHDVGPNNYDLGVGLTYPNRDNIHIVSFGITRYDGQETSVGVLLTSLEDVGMMSGRQEWEFEGILWNWSAYSKKEGQRTIKARVKGTYDSRTRTGKLYVLAHEQPKPMVEVLSWEEVLGRLGTKEHIIEFKHRKNGTLKRVRLLGVGLIDDLRGNNTRVDFGTPDFNWTGIGSGATSVETAKCSLPLALADGRIQFTAEEIDYTIYLPDSGYVMTYS